MTDKRDGETIVAELDKHKTRERIIVELAIAEN
jgi:hypothetical protein